MMKNPTSETKAREGITQLVAERDAATQRAEKAELAVRQAEYRIRNLESMMFDRSVGVLNDFYSVEVEKSTGMSATVIRITPKRYSSVALSDQMLAGARHPWVVVEEHITQLVKRHAEYVEAALREAVRDASKDTRGRRW